MNKVNKIKEDNQNEKEEKDGHKKRIIYTK